ncbi:hypothetical protein SPOG_05347 [Schizosaccharomyces cryophilus OY26]|uniref:Uncharacterized protein n=1 Tax=Schizosaccharomyces cryophilus (strain OY26 / ATCC MYA-4695 / CBS 11777 / NBRC 106824 / NRRL Y48691) TaxID=653667 RepID=S9VTK1_SCHCR|nr:uncharacterized protein SPOG_05347 [Schizosaccharomyces cryophilus OY26]EPY51203.1 hypothetical protein SPOG_05347 [Schizosaccharomyces cryophilus OY26]
MELKDMPHILQLYSGNERMLKHIWCLVKRRHQVLKTGFILTTIVLTSFSRIVLFNFLMDHHNQNLRLFIVFDTIIMLVLCFLYLCFLSLFNRTFLIDYDSLPNLSDQTS